MAEWSNAAVLKTVEGHTSGGSNPSFSAQIRRCCKASPFFYFKMLYYTYILKSQSHGTYYYGSTQNLEKRLAEHNSGRVRYTKGRRPWSLHYFEEFQTRSEAIKRAYFFKSILGYRYLKEKNIRSLNQSLIL